MALTQVESHYNTFLGPVYTWMVGDLEQALHKSTEFFRSLALQPNSGRIAVDLGCGFGLHSLPLAQLGFEVYALDLCDALLEELKKRRGELPIQAIHGDIVHFETYVPPNASLIVCMGDTLTHLESKEAVSNLLTSIGRCLSAEGTLILEHFHYSCSVFGI
jgi:2-polyprenyl-3-methyl-5-hydroxy-6-metoxy-1,4-benzoquinol methylase